MQFSINGTAYTVPASISAITLQDRIEFDLEHGKKLAEKLQKIIEIKDKNLQDLEFMEYSADCACRTVSFYGKIPLDIVQNTATEDVYAVYTTAMRFLSDDVNFADPDAAITHEFDWAGDTWQIDPVELKQGSRMQFRELITAKQVVQNLYELGNEKWQALLNLCCVFMRKVGEPFTDDLISEDGHRMKLMRTLPLDKALNVGFFLTNTINFYSSTSLYSFHPEQSLVENP